MQRFLSSSDLSVVLIKYKCIKDLKFKDNVDIISAIIVKGPIELVRIMWYEKLLRNAMSSEKCRSFPLGLKC